MPTVLTLLQVFLLGAAVLLCLPVIVLTAQVFSARHASRASSAKTACSLEQVRRPVVAVLVPAHNEADGIAATIRSICAQLFEGDRCVVVADNCTDETAAVAAVAGAIVIERNDPERRGKGFALDRGVKYLADEPPEVVVVVDADCTLLPGTVDLLARCCVETARPAQSSNLMYSPPGAPLKTRIAEFAFLLKTQVRGLGCLHLGLPCQLVGTGMAFPWMLIRDAPLASGDIVEDLRLGLKLAAAGSPPTFCPGAAVMSMFPLSADALLSQRKRWEQGHLGVIASLAPRLLWQAVWRRQAALAAMVIDICVPPVAALVLALCGLVALAAILSIVGGSVAPLLLAASSLLVLLISLAAAWSGFGRHVVTFRELAAAPLYVAAKLPMYARMVFKKQTEWVRTDRKGDLP